MGLKINLLILHRNHSWNTHHAVPLPVYCLWHSHPCNDNTVSVFIRCTLRGIEIQSVVQKLIVLCKLHRSSRFIECGKHTNRCGIICFSIIQQRHRGEHHNALAIHLEIVWTLPHPAKVVLFHVTEICPILQITALINQQSALVVNGASQNQIPCIFSTPYLRVTGVGLAANGFFCNGWNDGLFSFDIIERHTVIGRNHQLCSKKLVVLALINVFWIFLQIIDTCIK